jgi:hypothetical protein
VCVCVCVCKYIHTYIYMQATAKGLLTLLGAPAEGSLLVCRLLNEYAHANVLLTCC